jgi:hypothetical protein
MGKEKCRLRNFSSNRRWGRECRWQRKGMTRPKRQKRGNELVCRWGIVTEVHRKRSWKRIR